MKLNPVHASLFLFAIFVSFSIGRSQPTAPTDYSTEELVAAVTDQLTSIDSLYCEFTYQFSDLPSAKQCRYARTGEKWHYTEISADSDDTRESTYCYDGHLVYAYVIRKTRDGKESWSSVHLQDPKDQGNPDPESLLGARLSNVDRSLANVFEIADVQSFAVAEGARDSGALGLRARGIPSTAQKIKYDIDVVLDPDYGLLPRDILITQSAANRTWPEWANHWSVNEFREVVDERTQEKRWFPVAGRMDQGSTGAPTLEMDVEIVRINPTLQDTLFRPNIPDGTLVADTTSDGRGKLAFKGGDFVLDGRMKTLAKRSREALTDIRRTWMWVIGANVVMLLVVVICIWRRRATARSDSSKGEMS